MRSVHDYSTAVEGGTTRHRRVLTGPGAHVQASVRTRGSTPAGSPVVLLAVDDSRMRLPLEKFLRLRGSDVRLAATAAEAIDTIRSDRPAAAIVDLGDTPRPGLDVAVAMALPQPVILLSSTPLATRQLARVRPRTRVVGKPCSLILLIEALHDMLASAESIPELGSVPYGVAPGARPTVASIPV